MDPEFTPSEQMVLRACADSARTVRRRRIAIATGCSVLVGIGAAWCFGLSREFVLLAFAAYVVGAILERVAYANAVLAYKSVIRKLLAGREQSGDSPKGDTA